MNRLSKSQIQTELKRAREAFNRGDAIAANRQIDRVLHSNSDSAEAHFGKGMILTAEGRNSEALASYIQGLRYEPESREALTWAALSSLKLGRPQEAEGFARRLTRLQPKNDRAHFLLSSALSLQGRHDDSLKAIDLSLAIQPLNAEYLAAKAQVLARANWSSLAIDLYRKALDIHPFPLAGIELADLLLAESQVEEAVLLLEQFSTQLAPELRPYALMGRAYTESRRFDEAERYWASANKFTAGRSALIHMRAVSEIRAGRLSVAEELLCDALKDLPSEASFYQLLTTIRKMAESDEPLVQAMEQLLSGGNLNPEAEQRLNYALGKAYQDLNEYAKAIHCFDEANRLDAKINPNLREFDRGAWQAFTDLQIQFFSKERILSLAKEGLESNLPIFVMGMIRSGTTLTEQILSSHSMIKDGGEKTFWAEHRDKFLDLTAGRFDTATAKRLGRTYLRNLTYSEANPRRVIDKYPVNVIHAGPIHCVFPNAKLVHLKRHAVDNLLSIWTTPIKTGLPYVGKRENLVFAYRQQLRLVRHWEQVLPENRFKTFAYEAITSNPVPTIESILSFVELEVEPGCFSPEKNTRTVLTPSVYQVRQPINTDSQARWRKYEPWLGPFAELLDEGE